MFMKKIILMFALISVLSLTFVACGKKADEQSAQNKTNAVYENIVFDNLRTFSDVTSATLNSTIEDKTYETTFSYVVLKNADKKITEYKEYLLESGFKLTSSSDSKTIVFEFGEKSLRIDTEYGESDTRVNITIPCNKATNDTRKEKVYNEMLTAAEAKDFSKVFDITKRFSNEEIKNFKDVSAYRSFSLAMKAYDDRIYGEAREYFIEYTEKDTSDKLGGKAYLQECNNKLSKYNGTYSGKSFDGYVPYLMYVKDGKVGIEINTSEILGDKLPEAVYYSDYLRINEYNGHTLLYIVHYWSGEITNKYQLTVLDSGEIILNDNAWDMAKGYQNDTSTFAGIYKKTSTNTPSAK